MEVGVEVAPSDAWFRRRLPCGLCRRAVNGLGGNREAKSVPIGGLAVYRFAGINPMISKFRMCVPGGNHEAKNIVSYVENA